MSAVTQSGSYCSHTSGIRTSRVSTARRQALKQCHTSPHTYVAFAFTAELAVAFERRLRAVPLAIALRSDGTVNVRPVRVARVSACRGVLAAPTFTTYQA